VKNPPPLGQDCDRIGELVDEAIHRDNMAKVSTKLIKSAEKNLWFHYSFFCCTKAAERDEYRYVTCKKKSAVVMSQKLPELEPTDFFRDANNQQVFFFFSFSASYFP
jgi:hypothetical protein